MGGYLWSSKEVSLLDDDQKSALNNLGTNTVGALESNLSAIIQSLPASLQSALLQGMGQLAGGLNQVGFVCRVFFCCKSNLVTTGIT